MPDAILDYLGVFPAQILFAYAMAKMLPLRRPRLYWTLQVVVLFVVLTLRPLMPFWVRMAAGAVPELLPLLFSTGPFFRRLFIVVIGVVIFFAMELPAGALWIALTGEPTADYAAAWANLPQFAFVHVVHFSLLAFAFAVLYALVDRSSDTHAGMRLFLWFPLVQVVLFEILMTVSLEAMNGVMSFYVGGSAMALVLLIADVLLFVSWRSFMQKRREEERAASLQDRLDEHLAEYGRMAGELERVSRLRHDVRNQVEVVRLLSRDGSYDEARRHLDFLRADAAKADGGDVVA